jgi:hypothetical protein
VRKEVAAHSACWTKACPLQSGKRAATTRERWQQVHELRARNVGLIECARRLNLSLNTVKRYDRASEQKRLRRVPKYRPTLAGPHRDYLRKRRAEEPGAPLQQLLREIRERGRLHLHLSRVTRRPKKRRPGRRGQGGDIVAKCGGAHPVWASERYGPASWHGC